MKRTVYLRSFFIELLRHGLRYGVIFLGLTILFASSSFLIDRVAPKGADPELETLNTQLSNSQASLKIIEDYLNNSVIAKYDPLQLPTYSLFSRVVGENQLPTDMASQLYLIPMDDAICDSIRDKLDRDLSTQFLNEMMNLTYSKDSQIIRINVFYEDEAIAKDIAYKILERTGDFLKANSTEPLELEVVSETFTSIENTGLRDKNAKHQAEADRLHTLINTLKNNIAKIEASNQPVGTKQGLMKAGIFGIVLSAILSAVLIAFKIVSNRATLNLADISQTYQIPLLFGLQSNSLIKRLDRNEIQLLDLPDATKRLEALAGLLSDGKAVIVGQMAHPMTHQLALDSHRLFAIDGFLQDTAEMERFRETDNIILAIDPYRTSHAEFQEFIQLLHQLKKTIVGAIIL